MCSCPFVFLINISIQGSRGGGEGDEIQMRSPGQLFVGWSKFPRGQFRERDSLHGPLYPGQMQVCSNTTDRDPISCQMFCTCGSWSWEVTRPVNRDDSGKSCLTSRKTSGCVSHSYPSNHWPFHLLNSWTKGLSGNKALTTDSNRVWRLFVNLSPLQPLQCHLNWRGSEWDSPRCATLARRLFWAEDSQGPKDSGRASNHSLNYLKEFR